VASSARTIRVAHCGDEAGDRPQQLHLRPIIEHIDKYMDHLTDYACCEATGERRQKVIT